MAVSLYNVVEGEDPGLVNGHAQARNEDALERQAERMHIACCLSLSSEDHSTALLLD